MNERDIKYWIHVLGDDVVGREDKLEAVEVLTGGAKDALPLLIERLLDRNDAQFLGETPIVQGPLQAAGNAMLSTNVRYIVETILYRIIAPQRRPPEKKTALDALKPKGAALPDPRPPIPWVADWGLFWRAHKNHSLADIRAWSAEELDRRWQAIDDGQYQPFVPASLVGGAPAARAGGDDVAKDRAVYAKAREIFLEARRDPKKASDAKRALAALGASSARVKVHTEHMAGALEAKR